MYDSMYVEVFYGFFKVNARTNVHWFDIKTASLIYFSYNFLDQIDDVLWWSLFGKYLLWKF